MIIIDDNNYIKKYSKTSMIIITSKILKNIDDNNYIKKIFKNIDDNNRWEYLDQKYSKGLVGILR